MIQTDQATELRSEGSLFVKLCRANSIPQQFSPTYSPSLNGIAERTNAVLSDPARASLLDSNLPRDRFGILALRYSTWTINRTRKIQRNGIMKTPYEWLHGKQPDLSKARPFGAAAEVLHPPRHTKPKLATRTRQGIFVGYDEAAYQSYYIWFPDTDCIVSRRDVTILEDTFPYSDRPKRLLPLNIGNVRLMDLITSLEGQQEAGGGTAEAGGGESASGGDGIGAATNASDPTHCTHEIGFPRAPRVPPAASGARSGGGDRGSSDRQRVWRPVQHDAVQEGREDSQHSAVPPVSAADIAESERQDEVNAGVPDEDDEGEEEDSDEEGGEVPAASVQPQPSSGPDATVGVSTEFDDRPRNRWGFLEPLVNPAAYQNKTGYRKDRMPELKRFMESKGKHMKSKPRQKQADKEFNAAKREKRQRRDEEEFHMRWAQHDAKESIIFDPFDESKGKGFVYED